MVFMSVSYFLKVVVVTGTYSTPRDGSFFIFSALLEGVATLIYKKQIKRAGLGYITEINTLSINTHATNRHLGQQVPHKHQQSHPYLDLLCAFNKVF